MSATIKHSFLSPSNPIHLSAISTNFLKSHPSSMIISHIPLSFSTPRLKIVKCSSESNDEAQNNVNLNNALSSMVGEQIEELLNKEENRSLLDGLEKASMRVEIAKRQLAEIEKQELELKRFKDHINQLESRASEIEECQKEILEARGMIEEAERSLSQSEGGNAKRDEEDGGIDRDEERLESVKAASISAIVGTLAGLPIFLNQVTSISQLALPLAITFISCALFGVTFRYTIRRDLDNIQLKTGTSAAFGFVKGLATLDGGVPLEFNAESFSSHVTDAAVYVSENLYIFISAAVALEFCFKLRLLSPFPIRKSV
ncbi:uncharacterized protein LOC111465167 [Cucurbita maxima]|uniref:Uncharacterized protein LOC111465167 n=1 Tax=Cucurbita maxima TaxID=3661 RepID=A0A6J1HQG8_CUCMA|nr:uncharacterized protein LOC111465167 [Cucurbita maxima]